MRFYYFIAILFITTTYSCKKKQETISVAKIPKFIDQQIKFASGFSIKTYDTYKEIQVSAPWPDATDTISYILYPRGATKPSVAKNAVFISLPIEKLVVTSTTDIPMLEYLGIENKLVGFPNTDYISSEKTRKLTDNGSIKELGSENALNTETVLEIDPDLIIGFSSDGAPKIYDILTKAGITVVMNGSWLEQHPLGRAEWIKFIAAFFGKEVEAKSIFENIKNEYQDAVTIAKQTDYKPSILSGTMYKDIWHVPGGSSYIATFFKDANTDYLWANTKKTGSLALNFESVLEKAKNAQFWIGAGSAKSLETLGKENQQYAIFDAFKNKSVYSSALKTGKEGGILFYELGPMRPDLILKDIIKITHPETLMEYESYFFKKLK